MRKNTLLDKLLFAINSILAASLLISYLLPFVSPTKFSLLALLSLTVPFLIVLNVLFSIYWLLKLKKYFLLSGVILAIGFGYVSNFYKISEKKVFLNDDVKVMSYNVRMFNHYNWNDDKTLDQKAFDFIADKAPDILSLQEFYESDKISFKFPYQYIKTKSKTNKFGLAIYSKYKIINSGSLDFNSSANNAIYIDIVKSNDTVRVYNIHLESLKINPTKENLGEQSSEKLIARLQATFKKQSTQAEQFLEHQQSWKGKTIICGDFNNTAFSWVYNNISDQKNDAFLEAGVGFGKTFDYPFPMRIDFILTDTSIEVNNFKTFKVPYSDHYPIQARVNW